MSSTVKKTHKYINMALETQVLLCHSYKKPLFPTSVPTFFNFERVGTSCNITLLEPCGQWSQTSCFYSQWHHYASKYRLLFFLIHFTAFILLTWHPYVFLKTWLLASEKFSKIEVLCWYYTKLQKLVDVYIHTNFILTSIAQLLINITSIQRTEVLDFATDMATLKE